ncbi:amphi-Trp domain-containing protein [Brevibacterium luteolum]|nr:amphi-Trp domain-containing protein [Brevibacterium luteolum]
MKTVHLKTKEIRSRDELADLLQQLADQIAADEPLTLG